MPLPEVGEMLFSTDSLSVPGPGCNEAFDRFRFRSAFADPSRITISFFLFFSLNPIARLEKTKKGVIFYIAIIIFEFMNYINTDLIVCPG